MSGGLSFAAPWWLLLLPPAWLLVRWMTAGSRRRLSPARMRWTTALRFALVSLLVLAAADPRAWRREDRLTVIYAVDRSRSVDASSVAWVDEFLERQALEKDPRIDHVGVIAFGSEAMVDRHPDARWQPGRILSAPAAEGTDLASAVRLARGLFPQGHEARLVLLSDGVETTGSIEEALASNGETDVVWVPLPATRSADVLVEQVLAPERVLEDEPHKVRVVVRSSQDSEATLRLYRGGTLISAAPVQLRAGQANVFTVDQKVADARGAVLYRAEVDVPGDSVAENNSATALVQVEGRARVLILDSDPAAIRPLVRVLQAAGMQAEAGGASRLPSRLVELTAWDAVVLSDIAATQLSDPQLEALEQFVAVAGGGVAMLGGPESFGPGGYWKTPVEKLLPVDMDVKDKRHQPSVGMIFCIDKSGSMAGMAQASKIDIAKAAAAEVAGQLTDLDRVGVIGFDAAAKWVVPMTAGGDKQAVIDMLGSLRAGGGTDAYPALIEAKVALESTATRVKHVMLLTDGQLQARDHEGLANKMKKAGITVSAVGVGTDADLYTLERIARAGGGRFYPARDVDRLPRIFFREAFRVSRNWLVEEPFRPQRRDAHPALGSLDLAAAPPLGGYVATSEKPQARHLWVSHRGDPLLSVWRYGLGKSAAFTSDVKGRWSGGWAGWNGYAPFVSRLIRWTARGQDSASLLTASVQLGEGTLRIVADVEDREGGFVNGASLQTLMVGPDGRREDIELEQTAPGRYEARVVAGASGPYMAAVFSSDDRDLGGATVSAVVPYSREFQGLDRSPDALERLVAAGRVRSWAEGDDLFRRRGTGGVVRWALMPWLMALAALSMLTEVAVRKLRLARTPAVVSAPGPGRVRLERLRVAQARSRGRRPAAEQRPAMMPPSPPSPPASPASPASQPSPTTLQPTSQKVNPSVPPTSADAESAPAAVGVEENTASPDAGDRGSHTARLLRAKRRGRRGS